MVKKKKNNPPKPKWLHQFLISMMLQLHCPRKMPYFVSSTNCGAWYHYSLHMWFHCRNISAPAINFISCFNVDFVRFYSFLSVSENLKVSGRKWFSIKFCNSAMENTAPEDNVVVCFLLLSYSLFFSKWFYFALT